jgi:hypothetical protein
MKTFLGFIGTVLIVGTIFGGGLKDLSDWSTAEQLGGNTSTVLTVVGGSYSIYRAFKKSAKPSVETGTSVSTQEK